MYLFCLIYILNNFNTIPSSLYYDSNQVASSIAILIRLHAYCITNLSD